jgi:hypothetical protein
MMQLPTTSLANSIIRLMTLIALLAVWPVS